MYEYFIKYRNQNRTLLCCVSIYSLDNKHCVKDYIFNLQDKMKINNTSFGSYHRRV